MSVRNPTAATGRLYPLIWQHQHCSRMFTTCCSSSNPSNSNPRRGFGRQINAKNKDKKGHKVTISGAEQDAVLEARKASTRQPGSINRLSFKSDGKSSKFAMDLEFEERLNAVKRSALEQKKIDQSKGYESIDYDAVVELDRSTVGLGTKIAIGSAIAVFGLVFALGDFVPTGSENPTNKASSVDSKLSEDLKQNLQARLREYEAMLSASPQDPDSLEGAAVTLAELGEFTRAAYLLEDLIMKKPNDPDAFRLLGEVKYQLRDYEGSVAAYKRSTMVSKTFDFDVVQGLTNALLAAKKPDEAVQVLLSSRERLKAEMSNDHMITTDGGSSGKESQLVDPIQVELLLGKAYSDWGHVSDAVSIYDQLISNHPDDFRGYLAKGIILKQYDKVGDAERMFIQARFFAPEKAKALVDRYSRQ